MGFFSKIKGVTHNVEDVETPVPAMFATRNDTVYAPISGMLVSQKEINDEVISQGLLGQGYGVLPVGNVVYAPVNGRVDVVTVTNHAIGILTDNGAKVLVHVGLDTIKTVSYTHLDVYKRQLVYKESRIDAAPPPSSPNKFSKSRLVS